MGNGDVAQNQDSKRELRGEKEKGNNDDLTLLLKSPATRRQQAGEKDWDGERVATKHHISELSGTGGRLPPFARQKNKMTARGPPDTLPLDDLSFEVAMKTMKESGRGRKVSGAGSEYGKLRRA